MVASLQSVGRHDDEIERDLCDELERAGAAVRRDGRGAAADAAIILFEQASDEVSARVRLACRGGVERVVAVATAGGPLDPGAVWSLLQAGASDVLAWRRGSDIAAQIAARLDRWARIDALVKRPPISTTLIGNAPAWRAAQRQIAELAHFTDAAALVLGESGVGKELVARAIHALDPRRDKGELVIVDCTTIVPELAGSELFGHERGAFTSAVSARDGALALADGGTLFLDEIGELPLPLQAQLLRAIQERAYKRVGDNTWRHSAFRLVAATHRDLAAELKAGRFRHDLYHRIAAVTLTLPALRERREDILPLAQCFVAELRPDAPPALDGVVCAYLRARDYPGNVRELKQLVARLVLRHAGTGPISAGDIPEAERPIPRAGADDWRDREFERAVRRAMSLGAGLKEIGRAAEDEAVRQAIAEADGNLPRAARRLGVTDRALQLRRARGNGAGVADSR